MLGEWKLSQGLSFDLISKPNFFMKPIAFFKWIFLQDSISATKCLWNNLKLFKFIFKADKFQKLCFSLDFVLEIVNLLLFKPNEANSKFVFLQKPFVNMIFVGFEALFI